MKKWIRRLLRDYYATKFCIYGDTADSIVNAAYKVKVVSYIPPCLQVYYDNKKSVKFK